jgi:hypothetical protein
MGRETEDEELTVPVSLKPEPAVPLLLSGREEFMTMNTL